MRIILAPMEGVTDYHMRELLTRIGGYSRCVTEFLRVTDHLYPDRLFFQCCPELRHGGYTASGTPVYLQLLGSDPDALALNAKKAVELGARGVDLNFGCPAKTVNAHGGGSALLRTPNVVADIVRAVRDAVDPSVPVTAKMRLGFDDTTRFFETAMLIARSGASELCVHARTRKDGYRPPAHWAEVNAVQQALDIPVIINGEIWSVENSADACGDSRCGDIMLGRGALSRPDLARQIEADASNCAYTPMGWSEVVPMLQQLLQTAAGFPPKYAGNRTKQWLTYLRQGYPQAERLFESVKRLRTVDEMASVIEISLCSDKPLDIVA